MLAGRGCVAPGADHLALTSVTGSVKSARRPRLLVLNQYYWPGVEATANLLTELCEALAGTHDVTVVTGASRGLPPRQVRNGVTIVRVRSTTYDRSRLFRRAANYVTYVAGLIWRPMLSRRPDIVVCMTDPPFIGSIARLVAARFRAPLLIIMQDVFPEIAVKLGRLRNPIVVRLLRLLIDPSLRAADRVVVIGETMKVRVAGEGRLAGAAARDPELGRCGERRPAAAGQRVGAPPPPRRPLRGHALRQHRPRAEPRTRSSAPRPSSATSTI